MSENIVSSDSMYIGTSFLSYLPFIQWIVYFIMLVIGFIFLLKISHRLVKYLDLLIEEKKANKNDPTIQRH
ncbi:hypothetical protein [Paenibacillus wulumuqiensis]|uniref:hypothetical protein n=1 Tax=Paenibacillus wulumuqiensis TaxID=1567107 RepID=UPI000619E3F0|nr:hypothetical protein [Paenibacillus wulumuqiensis]